MEQIIDCTEENIVLNAKIVVNSFNDDFKSNMPCVSRRMMATLSPLSKSCVNISVIFVR